MMPTELPEGRYLSCAFALPPHAGGQTRALLMRNRIFASKGGVRHQLAAGTPGGSSATSARISPSVSAGAP